MTIEIKNSSIPGKIPQTSDLILGELAINTHDGRVYLKRNVNDIETIIEVSSLYDNSNTQFSSHTISDVLGEIDEILNSKITQNTESSLSALNIGDESNYTQIDTHGNISLNGSATYWKNQQFIVGTDFPDIANINDYFSAPKWTINSFYKFGSQIIDNAWKPESDIHFSCYVITGQPDIEDRYLSFEIRYALIGTNSQLSFSNTIEKEILIPANTPENTLLTINFDPIDMTGYDHNTQIFVKLTRNVVQLGDEPSNDPFCSILNMQIECDRLGNNNS